MAKRPPNATDLIHGDAPPGALARTVGPPIQKGSTVLLPNAAALYDDEHFLTYGRTGLAAQAALAQALAGLEGAAGVALYPSGVAALSGAMLALLKAGDAVRIVDTVYKPTRRFCDQVLTRYGVEVEYYDPAMPADHLFAQAPANLRLVLLESPGSLTLEMQDVAAIAAAARARGVLTVMDNTWGAGWLFRPLDHGVDVSVQSLTKYVGGHSDLFMGSAAARNPAVFSKLSQGITHMGWAVAGDDAYQMLRGLRTLPVRMGRHGESGLKIATWLTEQSQVVKVLHPALPGAPGHELWRRDYTGACGLFSIVLKPGNDADGFLDALKLFGLGFSWGGFESLALACDPQLKVRRYPKAYGGPVVRLHVGLEDPDDLIADLAQALAGV